MVMDACKGSGQKVSRALAAAAAEAHISLQASSCRRQAGRTSSLRRRRRAAQEAPPATPPTMATRMTVLAGPCRASGKERECGARRPGGTAGGGSVRGALPPGALAPGLVWAGCDATGVRENIVQRVGKRAACAPQRGSHRPLQLSPG